MKRFLCVLAIVLVLFFAVCCDDSETTKSKIQQLGQDLSHGKINIFAEKTSEDAEVEKAKGEIKNLLEETVDFIVSYQPDANSDDQFNELISVIEKYNVLASKYGKNPEAWTAVREYIKYATLLYYPNVFNRNGEGKSLFDTCKNLKEHTFNKQLSALPSLTNISDIDKYADVLNNLKSKVSVSKPSLTDTIFYVGSPGSVSLKNYYDENLISFVKTTANRETTQDEKKSKKDTFTFSTADKKTFSAEYKLNNTEIYQWSGGSTSNQKLTWSVKEESDPTDFMKYAEISFSCTFPSTKFNFDGEKCKREITIKDVNAKYKEENLPVSFSVEISNSSTGSKETFQLTKESFYLEEVGVYNPGKYTIKIIGTITNPSSKAETKSSSNSKTFVISDPLDGSIENLTEQITDSLIAIVLSLESEITYSYKNGKTISAEYTLEYYKENNPDFYNYLKKNYSSVKDSSGVYLISDLFSSLYLNSIFDSLKSLISELSKPDSVAGYLEVYKNYFGGGDVSEGFVDLEELANGFSTASLLIEDYKNSKTALQDFDAFNTESKKDYDKWKALIKLSTFLEKLDDAVSILKDEEILNRLNFVLRCLKFGMMYVEDIYVLNDQGVYEFQISPQTSLFLEYLKKLMSVPSESIPEGISEVYDLLSKYIKKEGIELDIAVFIDQAISDLIPVLNIKDKEE